MRRYLYFFVVRISSPNDNEDATRIRTSSISEERTTDQVFQDQVVERSYVLLWNF